MNLFNSQGNPRTADCLKLTGELDVDLRSDIAAEAPGKVVYAPAFRDLRKELHGK